MHAPIMESTENRLLATLPAAELEALRPHMHKVSLDHGDVLIKPHEKIKDVYFPITALASLVTVLEDGSTVEAGSVGREGMVGIPVILGAEATPMQTLIQIPGELIRVKASVIKEHFEKGGKLYARLNKYVHALFIIASQSAACNGRHQVVARMARWLLMSSDAIGSDQVNLTHEYLAAMLGVRRSGVTESARKLQDKGMILYKRGGIRIIDRPALETVACECYHVCKAEFDRALA
jgi:CRP-like cAMP-binding protein